MQRLAHLRLHRLHRNPHHGSDLDVGQPVLTREDEHHPAPFGQRLQNAIGEDTTLGEEVELLKRMLQE